MEKRKIRAKDVAADVHAGMRDSLLMKKYSLTPKQFEKVLKQLLAGDFIDHLQYYERTTLSAAM
jgi:hypothetical protein